MKAAPAVFDLCVAFRKGSAKRREGEPGHMCLQLVQVSMQLLFLTMKNVSRQSCNISKHVYSITPKSVRSSFLVFAQQLAIFHFGAAELCSAWVSV